MAIKNKIKFVKSISLFIFLIFFLNINSIFASEISIIPNKASYQVGDIVKLKVVVSSDISINAVSSYIKFSNDILNLSSFYKGDSLINFWAKEPSFSNITSHISFDGVILNGFSGKKGNILSLNFKAIKEGDASIYFESASVLANNGLGTETLTNKHSSVISITKAIPKNIEAPKEKENIKITEVPKEVILKIREIEEVNKLPVNLLVVLFGLLIILILIIIIILLIRYIEKIRKYLKNKIPKTEIELKNDFSKLENELKQEIMIISSDKKEENKEDEINKILEINKNIEESEKRLLDDIESLKKDS